MSRTVLLLSLCAFSTAALAAEPLPGESNDEVVTFSGEKRLFKGIEEAYGFDLWEEGVGIYAKADASSDLSFIMEGLSHLEWPEILDNSWGQTEKGGTITLENSAKIWIEITGEILGVRLGYELWRESVDWTDTFELRSLLLEGTRQGRTATLSAQGEDLVAFEEEYEVASDMLWITIGGAVRPILTATVNAERIEIGGQSVMSTRDIATLEAPDKNDGYAEYDAIWVGTIQGEMGLRLAPTITVKVDRFTFGPLTYPLDITLFRDTQPLQSDLSLVTHDLPAAVAGERTVDFGQVIVGDAMTRQFSVRNIGNVELEGVARVEGDGFVMPQEPILVPRTNDGAPTEQIIEIDFLPTDIGTFTGSIVLTTNDPIHPEIIVPIAGAGIAPPDDGGDNGDPNGGGDGDNLVSQPGSGCGCNSTTPAGSLGAFALLGLLGLVARRRR